ncbi:hypothetical protein FQR65_LT17720 [Abscondita terminalis]|nr:hypothetical protein FQR65_LT17720 [Abscondita terminalis]
MYIGSSDSEKEQQRSCGDLVAYLEKENRLPENKTDTGSMAGGMTLDPRAEKGESISAGYVMARMGQRKLKEYGLQDHGDEYARNFKNVRNRKTNRGSFMVRTN